MHVDIDESFNTRPAWRHFPLHQPWALCLAHVTRVDCKAGECPRGLKNASPRFFFFFCPYGWMEISMQTAVGCVRLIKHPSTHIQRAQTHARPRRAQYRICYRVKNCSAGILPNIMGVRGYTCARCMSTSLLVLWAGANRKHILMNGAAAFWEVQWLFSAYWSASAICFAAKQARRGDKMIGLGFLSAT